ncbi:MAG: hypothetical protein ACRDFS_12210 [Chloroflexota bacterium]
MFSTIATFVTHVNDGADGMIQPHTAPRYKGGDVVLRRHFE